MDPNQRLQLAQASSPSLRVAAAPSQDLTISDAPVNQPTLSAAWLNSNPDQPAVSVNSGPSLSIQGDNSNGGQGNQQNPQDLYSIKLPSTGKTLNQYVQDYNNADYNGQQDMIKQLTQNVGAGLDFGDQNIKNQQVEAAAALQAIKNGGVNNQPDGSLNGYLGFLGHMGQDALDHTINFGKNMLDSASAIVNNGDPLSTSIDQAMYQSGALNKDQYIQALNADQSRLSQLTGGSKDNGVGDRALRALGNAAEAASYAIPGAKIADGLLGGTVGNLAVDSATNAVAGGLSGLENGNNTTLSDVAGGTVGGGVGGAFGNLVGKAIHGITGLFKSGDQATAEAIANTSDPSVIQSVLGTSPEVAAYLASETDKGAISNLLKEIGFDGTKDTARDIITQSAKDQSAQQQPLEMFDPSNPTQSQLPAGWHPDGAPDPVVTLEQQVQHFTDPKDFATYVQHLSGEDAAAAKSALNGMSPEEFYAKAGGSDGTKAAAEGATSTQLPQGDLDAINQAGGNTLQSAVIPETTMHLPSKGIYAKLTPEQAGMLADEVNNVKSDGKDIVHLTAMTPALKRGAKEVSPEEIAAASPNAKATLDAIAQKVQPADLPAEHIDAIKQAGGELPKSVQMAASQLPAEDIQAVKDAGGNLNNMVGNDVKTAARGDMPSTMSMTPEEAAANAQVRSENANGIKSGSQIPNNDAQQALIDGLKQASAKASRDASSLSAARAQRADAINTATQGLTGEEATQARLQAMAGEYNHRGAYAGIGGDQAQQIFDKLRVQAQNDTRLFNRPYELTNVEDALKRAVLGVGIDGTKGAPTAAMINRLRTYFGDDVANATNDAVQASQGVVAKYSNMLGQVAGIPKSIMATMDLSGTLRQGGPLATRFPKEFAQAAGEQLKYFASEKNFEEGMAEIAARPSYQAMLDSKLAVTGTEALDGQEEQFVSHLMNRLPLVAGSERAYVGFLTKFRADVFDRIVSSAQASGVELDQHALDGISKYINTFSGRGDLGKFFEQHNTTLSAALFSPKLWKSRLDMLNPVYYAKLDPVARKYALQNAASFASTAGTVLGLASLIPGVSVSYDPRNSDFLKIKYGNERYDILGGLQQNLVLLAREATGEKVNSETGKVTKFAYGIQDLINPGDAQAPEKGPMTPTRMSILGDMFQNKENPLLAVAGHIISGKDRGGHPVNPLGEIANMLVPLSISGAVDTANDIGSATNPGDLLKGFAMNAPDMLGISAQNYGAIPTKYKSNPDAMANAANQEYTGPVQPNMVTDYNGKVILDKNGQPVTVNLPPGADDLTRQALIDKARSTAVKQQFVEKLPQEDQALIHLTDQQLKDYQVSGKISADRYQHILDLKVQESTAAHDGVPIPDGAQSQQAQAYYKTWNSMTKAEQQNWLKAAPDQNAQAVANLVNSNLSKGMDPVKPSNQLSQLYAKFEKDIHDNPDYTDIDIRQKTRAFQSKAAQLNYNENVQDLYNAGGNADVKTLIKDGKISKQDLSDAIKLDNQLYSSGIESSLKFNKTFRNSTGFALPDNYAGSGSGSSGGGFGRGGGSTPYTNERLRTLVPQVAKTPAAPDFSAGARLNPVSTVKFKAPNVTPSKGSTRVTAGGFRTIKLTTLRNSVAD